TPTTSSTAPKSRTTTTSSTASTTPPSPSTTTPTTAPDRTPPPAPTGLKASPAKRKVGLSWTGSTDTGGSGLAGYRVYRGTTSAAADFTLIASTTSMSYSDAGLRSATTDWYYVVAYGGAGNAS